MEGGGLPAVAGLHLICYFFVISLFVLGMGLCPKPQLLFCLDTKK
jgi:hypothetical protein